MKRILTGIVMFFIVAALVTGMPFQELEDNIGNELFYITRTNLPGDLTGYVPPSGILTQTKVFRISDGEGSVIIREAIIDGKTTTPQLIFDNLPETYTALAALYSQLRLESLADAQKYADLRDDALALVGE